MRLEGKTVIYGGSFDPPHMSHQISCLYLLEALGADSVWIIPSATHPFGKSLSLFSTRFAMCKLMAAPFAGRVTVMLTEQELGGNGHTYDTVCHLQALHPTRAFALAVGADILPETPRWHRWEALVERLSVVVLGRHGYPAPQAPLILPQVSSTQVRAMCKRGASLEGIVPKGVADFIAAHSLYR
ncbi:MAG: nicotinate-nicotinamide nucleotide adenylyltransferase [Deltaproteobacteria bacterium]|nr:MAG: nicotinate-nicotinamide nucleotide adenylyltransferase [Deltaproteobacteria bacterium]